MDRHGGGRAGAMEAMAAGELGVPEGASSHMNSFLLGANVEARHARALHTPLRARWAHGAHALTD